MPIKIVIHLQITDMGGTDFLIGDTLDRLDVIETNEKVTASGGKPAKYEYSLMGIIKASLASDSFISAASFQETTKVLTQAAVAGKIDRLIGLKENVIMGKLIPAGTGVEFYNQREIEVEGVEEEPEEKPEYKVKQSSVESLAALLG